MRIVILDGYTLNPGDLSWEQFQSLGECVIHDRTPISETAARSVGSDILLTNKTVLSKDIIDRLPDLKYIGVLATGFNVVDIKAAAERHIPVTNVPEYGTQSVAQMVFSHVLNLCNHAAEHSSSVQQGKWSQSRDFCFWDYPLIELSGLTMGIVGLGRIGSTVATIARSYGMDVIAYDPGTPSNIPNGATLADIETVFRKSDVVSLHCPLTEHNRGFVNAKMLGLMKPGSFLINTSRGPLIDESDLARALNSGTIAGAGLDVMVKEPPDADSPLLTARNCYITPHIAWATRSARQRLMAAAFDNVSAFIQGNRINVVNGVV